MKVVIFKTPEQKAKGLQHLIYVEPETLYVFENVTPGDQFHSRNVPEPFDIGFIDDDGVVLELWVHMQPPLARVTAPPGTAMAIEVKGGYAIEYGMKPGYMFLEPI